MIGFGTYFAVRAFHFGHLFPNTFYAKLDYGNSAVAARGWWYLVSFATSAPILALLCGWTLFLLRGASLWVRSFLAAVGLQLACIVYEGGDHFAMFQFFVPVIPFMCIGALYVLKAIASATQAKELVSTALCYLGVIMLGVSSWYVGQTLKTDDDQSMTHFDRFVKEVSFAQDWAEIGRWLHKHSCPGESLCTIAIGAIGYYSDLTIIDPLGLVDPVIAHRRQELGRGYAGHEKFDSDYVLSRYLTYILLFNYLTPEPFEQNEQQESKLWGTANKDLFSKPAFQEQYSCRAVPIANQFVNLHFRKPTAPGG